MDPLKLDDIEKDYRSALAKYKNTQLVISDIYNSEIDDEDMQSRIDEVLVDLGRVGELAYKYLLKLDQIRFYPNQSYEEFSSKSNIYKAAQLRTLVSTNRITAADEADIRSFTDKNNQLFHNFRYLELVFSKIEPDAYKNFNLLLDFEANSIVVDKIIESKKSKLGRGINYEDEYPADPYMVLSIFPRNIYIDDSYLSDKIFANAKMILRKMIDTAQNNGDIFTRLRYFSNHIGDDDCTKDDLININQYISTLVMYVKEVHKTNNHIINPDVVHGRVSAIKHKDLLHRTEDSINTIFDKYGNKDWFVLQILLTSGYTISSNKDEIVELKDVLNKYHPNYDSNDLYRIVCNGIKPNVLEVFMSRGIYDLDIINKLLNEEDEYGYRERNHDEVIDEIEKYKSKIK